MWFHLGRLDYDDYDGNFMNKLKYMTIDVEATTSTWDNSNENNAFIFILVILFFAPTATKNFVQNFGQN